MIEGGWPGVLALSPALSVSTLRR